MPNKNVLILCSDTFRHDSLTALHGQSVSTPHLDRLADQSMCFDAFWCCSFPTLINRVEVFTGRCAFPHHPWGSIPFEYPTLGQVFQRNGFQTAMAADNPHLLGDGFDFARGFDDVLGVRGHGYDRFQMGSTPMIDLDCAEKKLAPTSRRVHRYRRNAWWYEQRSTSTVEQVFNESFQWLERRKDPFFLWMDVFDPHEPWRPPEEFQKLYPLQEGVEQVVWPKSVSSDFYTDKEIQNMKNLYLASISHVDDWVGRLMAKLEALSLLDNTVVIFCSDHGFYFGDNGLIGKIYREESGLQTKILEPLGHVPLMIRHPDALGAGTHHAGFAQPQDLYPTALDLAGVTSVDWVHGQSLAPHLSGEPGDRTFMVSGSHPHKRGGLTCLTAQTPEWVLVYNPTTGMEGSGLYRRSDDPRQERNVLPKHRDVAKTLLRQLDQWFDDVEALDIRKAQMLYNKSIGFRQKIRLRRHKNRMKAQYDKSFGDYARNGSKVATRR